MVGTTGQGSTVALTTGGSVTNVRSLQLPDWVMEAIDASCITDSGFAQKVAGDLVDGGEVVVTVLFERTSSLYAPSSTEDTLTITFPLPTGGTPVAATLVGTGFVSKCSLPKMDVNGLLEQTFTFVFNGATGPTFTAGTEA